MIAVSVARERGFRTDERMLAEEVAATQRWNGPAERRVALPLPGNDYIGLSYLSVALASAGVRPNDRSDFDVHTLLGRQHASGRWDYIPYRPPIEGSEFTATAIAIRALRLFARDNRVREAEERVARGRAWLAKTAPKDTEDLSMQLLGLAWGGATRSEIERARARLIAAQRSDGGWPRSGHERATPMRLARHWWLSIKQVGSRRATRYFAGVSPIFCRRRNPMAPGS
jgi:hypothetical protein